MNLKMSLQELQTKLDPTRQAQLAALKEEGIYISVSVRMAVPDIPLYFLHLEYQHRTKITKGYETITGTLVDEALWLATSLKDQQARQ